MPYLLKILITMIISVFMQSGVVNLVSTTPDEAVTEFLDGLETRDDRVMEKYMDNTYVNFLTNLQGDEKVVERMDDALFQNFSYHVDKIKEKNSTAVAKVTVTTVDFSKVLDKYDKASYDYIMENLYTDKVADKDTLDAKCLDLYVKQIEKVAKKGKTTEEEVYIPMTEDDYYGWDIIMTDDLMETILGDLQIPSSD